MGHRNPRNRSGRRNLSATTCPRLSQSRCSFLPISPLPHHAFHPFHHLPSVPCPSTLASAAIAVTRMPSRSPSSKRLKHQLAIAVSSHARSSAALPRSPRVPLCVLLLSSTRLHRFGWNSVALESEFPPFFPKLTPLNYFKSIIDA